VATLFLSNIEIKKQAHTDKNRALWDPIVQTVIVYNGVYEIGLIGFMWLQPMPT